MTIYDWTGPNADSRQLPETVASFCAAVKPHLRRIARLRTLGATPEITVSVMTRSDFGGFELSPDDASALARLKLPMDFHLVANVAID